MDKNLEVGLSGATDSLWLDVDLPIYPPLRQNTRADVCIIGGGITGLISAYLLNKSGKSVILLDDGPLGGGETSRTTAHLSCVLDSRFFELERIHGENYTRLAVDSHRTAIDALEKIIYNEKIDCDFERIPGYLFRGGDDGPDVITHELDAAQRAGIAVELAARAPIPTFNTGEALRFMGQAQFHPLKFVRSLAAILERRGVSMHCHSRAHDFVGGPDAHVTTVDGHTIFCQHIIVATNTPVNDRVVIHTKQAAYRTYVIAAKVPKKSVPRVLYWDTASPFHYARVHPVDSLYDQLIVGGEDHKTGQADNAGKRFAALEKWARERFPIVGDIDYRWSGQVMETNDRLGFIGCNPMDADNVYVATGDCGNGLTNGTLAALIIRDLINETENPWTHLYDPGRVRMRASGAFAAENFNVAREYLDWLTPGDDIDEEDILSGEGAIIRHGVSKLAIYRDDNGEVFRMSAVCPHLGGIVHWNSTEKTWDCPCHGSRFTAKGDVINGPALECLKHVPDPEDTALTTLDQPPLVASPMGIHPAPMI